jgi:hypothetical protein
VLCASADEHTSFVEIETRHSGGRQALDAEELVEGGQTIPCDAGTLVIEVDRVAAQSRRWSINVVRNHDAMAISHDNMRQLRSTVTSLVLDAGRLPLCSFGCIG